MLQKAIDKSQKDWLLEDVLNDLATRDMQLWVWVEELKIVACCITQIIVCPQRKICALPFLAGSGLRRFLQCESQFIEFARANGCDKLEGFDRGGWLRVLSKRQWFSVWTTIRRDI